jgi:adenylosuccinate synthase
VGVAYEVDGQRVEHFPAHPEMLAQCKAVYETLPGWSEDISQCRNADELPQAAQAYVKFIEDYIKCPIGIVSVGPGFAENVALR